VKNIQDEISRCINQLLIKEPFYAHLLAGVMRIYTDEIDTAAVGFQDNCIALYINPDFFAKQLKGISQRVAVVKHETLHLVFKHLYRDAKFKNHKLLNIAADLVVNQYIGTWELPDFAITLKTFPNLNLKPKQSLEYYYKILSELSQNGETTDPESHAILNSVLGNPTNGDHSKWLNPGDSGNFSETILDQQITNSLKRTPIKQHGTIPGDLIDYIRSLEQKKNAVDWKRVLKIFANANGRTYVSHTMKRISKRYGTRPGVRIKRLWKLCLIIDTSGSIDLDTLKLFLNEINHIHKCGADITLVQCDAKIQTVSKYSPQSEIKVSGGGGTDFDPALQYIKDSKVNYGGIIYFTDGFASEPKVKISKPLLWVITPDGKLGTHLKYGKQIQLKISH
jgi:predicted metal-dependent peptidase